MAQRSELYISVDIEASGHIPGIYSLLSIGACNIDHPEQNFQCEIKPLNSNAIPEALNVCGLSLESLQQTGLEPVQAMQMFSQWLSSLVIDQRLVFVGLNAGFDWSFINYYFWAFLGHNPFGISALDIKSYFMAAQHCKWSETSSRHMDRLLHPKLSKNHNALDDALYQAELFRLIRGQQLKMNRPLG